MRFPYRTSIAWFFAAWLLGAQIACVGGGATGGGNPLGGDTVGGSGTVNWAAGLDEQEESSDESNTIYYKVGPSGAFEIENQPLDPGYPDPKKALDGEGVLNALVVKQISANCRWPAENKVRIQIQGTFYSKDGSTRILRIVDLKEKQFLNINAEGGQENNVDFTITTQAIESFRVYIMPKDFVPIYLNQELGCKNGRCSPKNKESIFFFTPLNVDLSELNAPLCLQESTAPEAAVSEL